MKLNYFLFSMFITWFHAPLAIEYSWRNYPLAPHLRSYYPNVNNAVGDYYVAHNPVVTYHQYTYTAAPHTIVHTNTQTPDSSINTATEQPDDNFDWSSFWSEVNKNQPIQNNNNLLNNASTETTNLENHTPYWVKQNNIPYERSPAAALIKKKIFSIECCDTRITNFDQMRKHIKDYHYIDGLFYARHNYNRDLSYSTAALAASKVINTDIPGFFNCPDEACRLNLACLTSLRNHYKRKHKNKPLEESVILISDDHV